MGKLVAGKWDSGWYDTKSTGGKFQRDTSRFRNWITPDGSAGPTGEGGFAAERDRYHLYVSYACPWAHRTLIFRRLKSLEPLIDISVVHPDMLADGWTFATDFPGTTGDRLFGAAFLRDLYTRAVPDMSGRVAVKIKTATLTLGSVTEQAAGPDFFDIAAHPVALFTAEITPEGAGYIAKGKLALRGAEVSVALPFSLNIDGDVARMTGQLSLDRRDFGMGASYKDESTVGFGVRVDVTLTAKRAAVDDPPSM